MRREKVAVLTQGTLTDAEMLAAQPEASYLLALAELPVPGKHCPLDSVCCFMCGWLCWCREYAGRLPLPGCCDSCQLGGSRCTAPVSQKALTLHVCCETSIPADDLMAASEHSGAPPAIWIGACAVDCATGQMLVGQWLDDELRSQVGGWAR